MTVLRSESLTKSYGGREVVSGVDIRVQSGEIIGLLGRNGAGKTTTFQMVVGLVKPDQGATYLPQENSVFLKASVENNLRLILELLPYKKEERTELRHDLLDELGLLPLSGQSAHSLSGGERRKLEISRSLVLKPKFLLLDEPFTGIDPLTIVELQKILLRLKEKGIGIVISDHNVRDTLRITDRAYILDEGKVLIEGSPTRIAADERARTRFLGDDFSLT
jgi:lipopolysaccharide export system ATP-binding protein